jgi:hypothetical protein
MPNGGSDCCGTCWFNEKNKGEAGYNHRGDAGREYCLIRRLEILSPMYTYCANHPHRNPNKLDIPLGPVFIGDSTGFREIWQPSPDTEEIRQALVNLVSQITEQPENEYPIGIYLDEIVIWQLGEFKERRAIEHLQRIVNFNPDKSTGEPFHRARASTISAAETALRKIIEQEDQED